MDAAKAPVAAPVRFKLRTIEPGRRPALPLFGLPPSRRGDHFSIFHSPSNFFSGSGAFAARSVAPLSSRQKSFLLVC